MFSIEAMKADHFVKCGLKLWDYNAGKECWDTFQSFLCSDSSMIGLETKQRYSLWNIIVVKVNILR